jgi:predicted MFS family arabinose efflux permease
MVLATNFLAATQDIATDALAVELLQPRERGLGNGVQVAGYRAGMIVGGGALLMAFGTLGWVGTFAAMAALLGLATLPVLALREAPHLANPLPKSAPTLRILLTDRRAWPWFAVLLLFKAGEGAETAMLRPLLVDRGLDLAAIGWLMGTVGFAAGLLGALLGGWVADRVAHRTALGLCGFAQALGLASWVVAAQSQWPAASLGAFVALEHLTSGMATAALFTAMMDRTHRQSAASHYTLQASLVVIGSGLAAALSGWSARQLGYAGHFGLCALLGLAGMMAALLVTSRDAKPPTPAAN